MVTRGERNNNPGNIVQNDIHFVGEVTSQDDRFKAFDSPQNGIRAIAKIILTYYRAHGLGTIAGLIGRWAPSVENDTIAYIRDVAAHVGVQPNEEINVEDEKILDKIVTSIIFHENGEVIYSSDTIIGAVDSALGS